MKQVTTYPPYKLRPSSEEGIYAGIPDEMRFELSRLAHGSSRNVTCHRFWIQVDSIEMTEKVGKENYVEEVYFGEVKMSVRYKPMIISMSSGALVDDDDLYQRNLNDGADEEEAEFCRYFTEHYDEIAIYYPEFARLKELAKLLQIGIKLRNSGSHAIVRQEAVFSNLKSAEKEALVNLNGQLENLRDRWMREACSDIESQGREAKAGLRSHSLWPQQSWSQQSDHLAHIDQQVRSVIQESHANINRQVSEIKSKHTNEIQSKEHGVEAKLLEETQVLSEWITSASKVAACKLDRTNGKITPKRTVTRLWSPTTVNLPRQEDSSRLVYGGILLFPGKFLPVYSLQTVRYSATHLSSERLINVRSIAH